MTNTEALSEAVTAALTGHRSERWRVDLLALDEAPVGTLDGVAGGSLDFSIHTTIRSGGNLTIHRPLHAPEIDWHRHLIQPWYVLDLPGGSEHAVPMGVFIPAASARRFTDGGVEYDLELFDKLLILDQDATAETWAFPAGTNVVSAVRHTIESATGDSADHAIEDSPETLSNAMVWEAGTSKLRIVNDLLDAINYFALVADGHGVYRAGPYIAPASRALAWRFADDEASIYLPEFSHDRDTFAVPNRVVAISTTDGEDEALVAFAQNEDPDSPFSFQARGRWITHVESDVEATSQQVLDDIAQRRLVELMQPTSTFEIEHALVPLSLNDAVTFRREPAGIDVRAVVQKYTVDLDLGGLVTTTLREVVT